MRSAQETRAARAEYDDACQRVAQSADAYRRGEHAGQEYMARLLDNALEDYRRAADAYLRPMRPCSHPLSCPDCARDGGPCGRHLAGTRGHESCSGVRAELWAAIHQGGHDG